MKCEEILKHIQSNVFYAVFDSKSGELLKFEFIKFNSFSKWDGDLFDVEFVKRNLVQEDLKLFYEAGLKLKESKNVEVVYRFKKKDGGFVFIKSKLSLVSYDEKEIYCIGTNENVTNEKEYEIIVDKIRKSPHIGYVIFRQTVLYANDYAKNILPLYRKDMPLYEIIKSIPEAEIRAMLQKRLRGENFFMYRKEVEIDSDSRKFIDIYAQTIVYQGDFAGLAIITDQTDHVKRNTLLKILNDISDNMFKFTQKRKFFEEVARIVRKYGYKIYIRFPNFKIYDDDIDVIYHDFEVVNLKEGKYKSYLYMPVDEGIVVLYSEFENEFEEKFYKDYTEIKKVITFAVTTIRHNMLMHILKEAIEKSYQWVLITDEKGGIIYVNDVVTQMTGLERQDILGKTPLIFNKSKSSKELFVKAVKVLKKKEIFEDLFIGNGKDGMYYLKIKIIPVEVDEKIYYVALGIDMTKEKKLHDSLFIDEMTGFLNRKGFLLRGQSLLKDSNFVLLLIDIRNFKALNQIRGSEFGNLLLKQFAYFLKTFFYEEDLIARIGGDEFAVLIRLNETGNVVNIVQKLLAKINNLEGITVNIGVSLFDRDAKDINTLLEKAYIALEYAKKEGENGYEFYNENLKSEVEKFLRAKSIIADAIKNNKFEYYFQPYYDVKENKIVGAEALIRIMDKEMVTPDLFIDYAEKSGIIKNMEKLIFNNIPKYMKMLQIPISFNISAISFKDEEHIKELCKWDHEYPLIIELTERTVAKNLEYAKKLFDTIKSKNFKIAIDDFGTGYSSLSYIKDLNFDILKIDISFIKNIVNSYKDLAVVKTIITLAKALNLKTVAEGVETKEQFEILKDAGCDIVQGYLIARPMSAEETKEFIKNFKGIV